MLAQFLSLVFARPAAGLIDLGDDHARRGALDRFSQFLERRFPLPDASVDAVLCWDICDYLAPAAATVLADEMTRVPRPAGALLAFFRGGGPDDRRYTKDVIEDNKAHLRHRAYAAACSRAQVRQNRDIQALFAGFELFGSGRLKSGAREVRFRKPAAT